MTNLWIRTWPILRQMEKSKVIDACEKQEFLVSNVGWMEEWHNVWSMKRKLLFVDRVEFEILHSVEFVGDDFIREIIDLFNGIA